MLLEEFADAPPSEWKNKLAQANDIDDISAIFRQIFQGTMPPSNSPFFKDTYSSETIPIDQLVPREAADPERVKNAHKYMLAASSGTGEKRAPVRVIDMGNGKFKVLDGNTTLQALKDLGEKDVVVEIKKSMKQQGIKTIDDVYAAAGVALPAFKEWVEAFGAKTGATVVLRAGLKGKDRAAEKVENDYKGDASKLLDVVGATLVFDTTAQVAAASRLISKDPAVFGIKNRFENPTKEGYPGIMMNVMIGGHICELQMNTASIIDAKENGLGHDIHKVIRQLKPIAKQEDMGETSILADGFISRLNKLSAKVYQAAAASRMSSSNSSASNIASDSETLKAFDVILNALSSSSISSHFAIDLPHMRNTLPPDLSMAYGTKSFSINSKLRDSISDPPFDTENITRNGGKVNAKVITGRRTRSYLNDNDVLSLQYAVIEAKNLVSSHNADFTLNPEFPAELQPRDRTRDSMKGQISSISNTLNPDRLGGSLYASVGSPIVGRDLVVESGNGRTMGIKQRYNKDGATEYKQWIIDTARKFGIDSGKLAEIQQPVLVRIRLSGEDRKSITERANEADIASMSPMEQAKVDDSRLTAADMESFAPSKDGDITAASNTGFIAKFIEKVGKSEAAGLLTADSRPTKALVDRIQCAIFSKAYSDDRLLTLMAEETHPAVKNILTALTAAAPVFAKIRASYPDMGGIKLVDNIIEATRLMVQARDDGDGIEMILSQMGLFSQISEETKTITRVLNDNIRRSKHLGTVFKLAGERILTFLQDQNQVGLFGKQPPPTASEVITGAIARAAELDPANRQKGIFEDGDEGEDDDEDEDDPVMESAASAQPPEPWRLAIINAKTFMDIEAVFRQEFPDSFPGARPGKEYIDTGEKIGGARKDKWAEIMAGNRQLDIADMDGMDSATAAKLVTKPNVIQGLVDSFREHGFDPGAVSMIQRLFSTYSVKPDDTDQARINYVAASSRVSKYMQSARTLDGFKNVLRQIKEEIGGVLMTPEQKAFDEDMAQRTNTYTEMRQKKWNEICLDHQYISKDGRGFLNDKANDALHLWDKQVREELFPEGIRQKHNAMINELNQQAESDPTSARNQYRALGDRFINAVMRKSDAFQRNLMAAKEITDFTWLEKESGQKIKRDTPEKPKWTRYVPDTPERTGGTDKEFKPQDLIDTFGIRGVEYGNWMDHESSEHHTQMLGLSFMDLSDVLGIPIKHISHGGKLAVAFGARGSGNAAAHYEPTKKAINMTKMRGGGSLAHEWSHFLDNVVSMVASGGAEQFSLVTGAVAAQEAYQGGQIKGMKQQPIGDGIPTAVKQAFMELHSAMSTGTAGGKPSDATKNKYNRINTIDAEIQAGVSPQQIMDNATKQSRIGKYVGRITYSDIAHYIHSKTGQHVFYDKTRSQFYADSSSMSPSAKDNYWTRPHELFARAFECYISDKMDSSGRKNTYLVSGVNEKALFAWGEKPPYPTGDERKRINAAFDKLIDSLKSNQILEKALCMSDAELIIP